MDFSRWGSTLCLTHDYFDLRRELLGCYYVRKSNLGFNGYFSPGYRKEICLTPWRRTFAADGDRTGRYSYAPHVSLRYRVNDKLSLCTAGFNQRFMITLLRAQLCNPPDAPTARLGSCPTAAPWFAATWPPSLNTATGNLRPSPTACRSTSGCGTVSNVHYRTMRSGAPICRETLVPAYQRATATTRSTPSTSTRCNGSRPVRISIVENASALVLRITIRRSTSTT
jgi:hypothetical protein